VQGSSPSGYDGSSAKCHLVAMDVAGGGEDGGERDNWRRVRAVGVLPEQAVWDVCCNIGTDVGKIVVGPL
jgi:hypothetical protein